jgi:glycosyltransferase involved in cell wall biosynthesis
MSASKKLIKLKHDHNNQLPWVTVALSTAAKKNHLLQEFLSDLQQQSDLDFELLVIIQSTDTRAVEEIKTIVSQADLLFSVTLIVSDKKGLLASRNTALGGARGRYILLADDDCRFFSASIAQIKTTTEVYVDSEILTFQAVTPEGKLLNPRNISS